MSYIPRRRSEKKKLEVLNSLLASILSAYKRCGIFSHEVALPYVDKSVLNEKWLTSHLEVFKDERSKYVALLKSTSVADSRLEDFRNVLPLAVDLSPEHAMQWLVITDKVKLLAENFGSAPAVMIEQQHKVDRNDDDNPVRLYRSTLNIRMMSLVEEIYVWLYVVGKS